MWSKYPYGSSVKLLNIFFKALEKALTTEIKI